MAYVPRCSRRRCIIIGARWLSGAACGKYHHAAVAARCDGLYHASPPSYASNDSTLYSAPHRALAALAIAANAGSAQSVIKRRQ